MARTEFTVGWWQRLYGSYLSGSPPMYAVRVLIGGIIAVDVQVQPTTSSTSPQFTKHELVLRYWGSAGLASGGSYEHTHSYLSAPPRDTWADATAPYQLRVQCSTTTDGGASYAADGTIVILRAGVTIFNLSGLTLKRYSATDQITLQLGPLIDMSRVWVKHGVTPHTVDSDGYPAQSGLVLYDDFSSGISSSWAAWDAGAGFTAALPTLHTTGGAAGGHCISGFYNPPSSSSASFNQWRGITRVVALTETDPDPEPEPEPEPGAPIALPVSTPGAPQTNCTPQAQVGNGGKGNAGCNTGGVGWERTYTGPWGEVPQHANPAAGETLTGKETVEVWTELVHTDEDGNATTYRQACVPLADDPTYEGGYKKDGLLAVGDIEHAAGNEHGGIEAATVDLEYTDAVDGQYRELLDTEDIEGDELYVKVASDEGRAAGAAPMILMRGVVHKPELETTRRAKIHASDQLFAVGGPFGPDAKFPGRTYGDLGRGAPQMTADTKATPIVPPYGELSDRNAVDPLTNATNHKGLIPGVFLGMFTVSGLARPPASTGYATYEALRAAMQASKDAGTLEADFPQMGVLDAQEMQDSPEPIPETFNALAIEVGYDDAMALMASGSTPAPAADGEWGILAFGYGPVHTWLKVHGSDLGGGNPENKHDRTELDFMARAGSDLLVPGDGVCPWDAFTITNPDTGEVFDLAAIGVRGPVLDDHRNGVVNIAASFIGLYDADGNPYGTASAIWQHALENFILAGKTRGPWVTTVTAPKWADGTPMVNSASYTDLQARSAVALGGDGLLGRWYQDRPIATTEVMARFQAWTGWTFGVSRHGQMKVFGLDERADRSTWRRLNHVTDLYGPITHTFGEEKRNVLKAVGDWDPDASKYRLGPFEEQSDRGIRRNKNRRKGGEKILENDLLADEQQIRWVLRRTLARTQYGTNRIQVVGPKDWLDLDVGDGVLLTSDDGTGPNGYVDLPCIILRRRFSFTRRLVVLTLWNVRDVLIATRFENGLGRLVVATDDTNAAPIVTDDESLAPLVLV